MEAKELRIGNLLHFQGTDMVAKVQLINAPNHFDCRDEYGSFVPNGEYEPIPLTEEWLLKFGFIKKGDSFILKKGKDYSEGTLLLSLYVDREKIQISVGTGGDSTNYIFIPFEKSVHKLQNLYFALTGEELTLKTE